MKDVMNSFFIFIFLAGGEHEVHDAVAVVISA
jgi:hypothetical protein